MIRYILPLLLISGAAMGQGGGGAYPPDASRPPSSPSGLDLYDPSCKTTVMGADGIIRGTGMACPEHPPWPAAGDIVQPNGRSLSVGTSLTVPCSSGTFENGVITSCSQLPRRYTVDEIDRMRDAIMRHDFFKSLLADSVPLSKEALEERLHTYMSAGVRPEELEASGKKP